MRYIMVEKHELEKAVNILQEAKWANGRKALIVNGVTITLLSGLFASLVIYQHHLISEYDNTRYPIGDSGLHGLCGKGYPVKNLCHVNIIQAAMCQDTAEDLCPKSTYSTYTLLVLGVIFIAQVISTLSFYAVKPLREYNNRSLSDLVENDRLYLHEIAQKIGISMNPETSISDALQTFYSKLDEENSKNENAVLRFFRVNQQNYQTLEGQEVENFQNSL